MRGEYSPSKTGIYNETILIDTSRARYNVHLVTSVWVNDKGYLDGEVVGYTITNIQSKNKKEVHPSKIIQKIRDGKVSIANTNKEDYDIYQNKEEYQEEADI